MTRHPVPVLFLCLWSLISGLGGCAARAPRCDGPWQPINRLAPDVKASPPVRTDQQAPAP